MSVCVHCGNDTAVLLSAFTRGHCLACALRRRHQSSRPGAVGCMDDWSEASRRSRSYAPGATVSYFDEYYWCSNCGAPSVFTAVDQKHAFEVEKRYFLQRRTLCDPCWRQRRDAPRAGRT
jgi:hypothetical protein